MNAATFVDSANASLGSCTYDLVYSLVLVHLVRRFSR